MTPYIQQQLKKLCDNPNWYDDMLISWDKNPRNQRDNLYNNLYDTLVEELKDTISRFKAQYNIQEINPYISDILQNPEDLISRSHNKEYR